jgi:hypothetical protein
MLLARHHNVQRPLWRHMAPAGECSVHTGVTEQRVARGSMRQTAECATGAGSPSSSASARAANASCATGQEIPGMPGRLCRGDALPGDLVRGLLAQPGGDSAARRQGRHPLRP